MPNKSQRDVKQYTHDEQKRLNNPPVGLVTAETDHLNGKKTYQFDPHLNPQLQWAGKEEGLSFEVDSVSLHVHERIDPLTIIEAIRKKEATEQKSLFHYFETKENNPPIREAIEFYKHKQGWSNRLIAGDSLIVMNSLLEKEGMAGKVQMIYIDPPYGIKYGSNFQPFVNKKVVTDGKDEDLTQEPEMIRAFRDTWELGVHSYLTYLRNRLLLSRELLSDSGSIFIQISDENIHLIRALMDEIFGKENQVSTIVWKKGTPTAKHIRNAFNYLVWYAKNIEQLKTNKLYYERTGLEGTTEDPKKLPLWGEFFDAETRTLTTDEKRNIFATRKIARVFRVDKIIERGDDPERKFIFNFEGEEFTPKSGYVWRGKIDQMEILKKANRILKTKDGFGYKFFIDDNPIIEITNMWEDTAGNIPDMIYVVQTNEKIIERCMQISTIPGDLVFDPTCGSGTTAFVAEQCGRRWITCDTSRVAITISKQRLMTASFDYYELAHPEDGVSSGFHCKTVNRVTLKSIANKEPAETVSLFDQPFIESNKLRIAGPFTVEAVPSQRVRSFEEVEGGASFADSTVARSGQTLKQNEWIDEMLATGVRGKNGQVLEFARIEPLAGTMWVQAEAETKDGKKAVLSFGPEYAPLEQRQVELAIDEVQQFVPKPKLVIFASFMFDPEAAKDIDVLKWPGVDVLKVQMNTDLLTADLKKKRPSNESFWLMGQPDINLKKQGNKYLVFVNGFDYYNTKTGEIESGDISKIAMWELDTDYDGRSLYPRQVFFPMAGSDEGWSKLSKTLKAQIDEEKIESYRGNTSLPFKLGNNKQVAVKIIDDRGIESLKIIKVEE